nr:MAG TPA: hypothetical protein [Caudoviricetes sp.]
MGDEERQLIRSLTAPFLYPERSLRRSFFYALKEVKAEWQ